MIHSLLSAVPPAILEEDRDAVHSLLQATYAETKKQLQQGITVLKEEFAGIYNKAEECINYLTLPVNNFLKDFAQIEKELEIEAKKEIVESVYGCNFVPIEQVYWDRMEENY